ncbi:AAA family ATPase [Inquilinus sp. CAU 1745]|uniref:zeta toxin family protein n=1 Tax=Inquilinus sp. CAU 1745 TaxID=3140369 RepID=UPI00325B004D
MIVLAGPNGAGKSTLYVTRVAPRFAGPFINADIIQRDELGDPSPAASYQAARLATARRADFLAQGRDFVTETVFSHPSKLDLIDEAHTRGFTVIVMHVGVNSPDLSVARVSARVGEGGHTVPEDKIRARYVRGGALIREAVLKADRGMVYDNSKLNMLPTQCLVFAKGWLLSALPILPDWIRIIYAQDLVR